MKKVVKYFGFGMVILLMAAAGLTFLAPRLGWRVDAVMSGSMEPRLKVGGLVITRPIEPADIQVGDTITFYSQLSQGMVSHRVIAIESGLSYFRTKGDANEDPDPFIVPAQNIVGQVCFHIPYLGYVIQFLKSPLGILLTFCIPGFITIAMEIRNIWLVVAADRVERKQRVW